MAAFDLRVLWCGGGLQRSRSRCNDQMLPMLDGAAVRFEASGWPDRAPFPKAPTVHLALAVNIVVKSDCHICHFVSGILFRDVNAA
jgi:hypothetical protein